MADLNVSGPLDTMAGTAQHMQFDAWARKQNPPFVLHVRPLEQQRGPLNIFSNQRTQHAWEGFLGALDSSVPAQPYGYFRKNGKLFERLKDMPNEHTLSSGWFPLYEGAVPAQASAPDAVHQWRMRTPDNNASWHDAPKEWAYERVDRNYEARTLYRQPAAPAPLQASAPDVLESRRPDAYTTEMTGLGVLTRHISAAPAPLQGGQSAPGLSDVQIDALWNTACQSEGEGTLGARYVFARAIASTPAPGGEPSAAADSRTFAVAVANNDMGVHVVISQKVSDVIHVLYSGKHPAGDSMGVFAAAHAPAPAQQGGGQ